MPKVIMLDVDGVLVDGRPRDGRHQFTDLKRDLGLSHRTLARAFFKPFWPDIVTGRAPLMERLEAVLSRIAPHVEAEALVRYWFENDSRLDHAVLAALPDYREAGTRVFLATNQEHLRARYLMDDLGLSAHVEGMLYSAALGCRKPEAAFFRRAGDHAGVPARDIVLVDDTRANVEAARACGWRAVRWRRGDGSARGD